MIEKQVIKKVTDGVKRCLKNDAQDLNFFLMAYEKEAKEGREIFFVSNGPKKRDAGLILIKALDILEEGF